MKYVVRGKKVKVTDDLKNHVEGSVCLDLFAGSGAMGLEALSRGARKCYFVEKDRG